MWALALGHFLIPTNNISEDGQKQPNIKKVVTKNVILGNFGCSSQPTFLFNYMETQMPALTFLFRVFLYRPPTCSYCNLNVILEVLYD